MSCLFLSLKGYSFVSPSIIFGENEFTKGLLTNNGKPSEQRPAPGAVDYAALFEVTTLFNPFSPDSSKSKIDKFSKILQTG